MAEGFLRELLERRAGDPRVSVTSAGTIGWEGSAPVPEAVVVAAERGIDISTHVARRLDPGQIAQADLVVGMTGEHRDESVALLPEAASKAFTLKEVVRLLENSPFATDGSVSPEWLAERVADSNRLRAEGFRGLPEDEDVIDPLGMPVDTFRAVAWEIGEYCQRLCTGLFGKAPAQIQAEEPQP
jgi:protein-tyrosine-phosphatase